MHQDVRFVTPEEFEEIVRTVEKNVGRIIRDVKPGTRGPIEPWFPRVLRVLFATGCRPAEVMGTPGRTAKTIQPGRKVPSRVKPHHGLRARDVLGQHRLHVEGKHKPRASTRRCARERPRELQHSKRRNAPRYAIATYAPPLTRFLF